MQLSSDHQALVDFFSTHELPSGPQHVNAYSVYLNLPNAVTSRLRQLHSEVEATRKSAALMLDEVKNWLETKPKPTP